MINLMEYINPETILLTTTEKMVLATIFSSPTPELAYEATSGTENVIVSRNKLRILGFVKVGENKTIVTDSGKKALISNNLIDDMDQLTDEGKQYVDVLPEKKKPFIESMDLFKTFI